MRTLTAALTFVALLAAGQVQATDAASMEKVRSGVLLGGGFYNIYAVECADQSSSSVVRLQRGSRWCTSVGGQLDCFRQSAQAVEQACDNRAKLAATDARHSDTVSRP